MRYCTLCGGEIDADAPHYYTKCRACYRGAKQQEAASLAAELEKQRELAAKYRSLAIERRLKIEELEAQGGGAAGLTPKRVNELLMLVASRQAPERSRPLNVVERPHPLAARDSRQAAERPVTAARRRRKLAPLLAGRERTCRTTRRSGWIRQRS